MGSRNVGKARIEAIRQWLHDDGVRRTAPSGHVAPVAYAAAHDLLAEVDRLYAALEAVLNVLWMADSYAQGKRRDAELFERAVAELNEQGVKWR